MHAGIPEAASYALVLFDGLGDDQVQHGRLVEWQVDSLDAPFPSTTTVALSTLATGLTPRSHGVIGHQMWLPELAQVVNVLKWITPFGETVRFDTNGFLPSPNLWERLRAAGCEPVTVQPADFAGSPLTRMLYRGARFEGVTTAGELIDATVDLAATGARLIFTYVPHLDFAGHVYGKTSPEYQEAWEVVCRVWEDLADRLPSTTALIGTGDHGLIDYEETDKIRIRGFDDLVFYGDPRSLFVKGEASRIVELGETIGIGPEPLDLDLLGFGPDASELAGRLPDAYLAAPDRRLLLPKGFDRRLIGYHGGRSPTEMRVPLLVGNR